MSCEEGTHANEGTDAGDAEVRADAAPRASATPSAVTVPDAGEDASEQTEEAAVPAELDASEGLDSGDPDAEDACTAPCSVEADSGGECADCADGICANGVCAKRVCSTGQRRPCDTHAEDGLGTCTAGEETCSTVRDPLGKWGQCVGSVGPQGEACGPQAEDKNCDGIRGNGVGCTRTLHVLADRGDGTNAVWCENGSGGFAMYAEDGFQTHFFLTYEFPSSEYTLAHYTELTSFKVFVDEHPDADVGVFSCNAEDPGLANDDYPYYAYGSCDWSEEVGLTSQIMGYVASTQATGYLQLREQNQRIGTSGGNFYRPGLVGAATPAGCGPDPVSLWTIP